MARELYQTGPSHDFSHVERVFHLALRLGRVEKADLKILGIAALFHDLARNEEAKSGGKVCHAIAGARYAEEILTEKGEPPELVRAVAECISTHRYRDQNPPKSLEGKCLFDADKLDSLGVVGIARAYLWLGERGGTVYVKKADWEKTDFRDNHPAVDSLQREWHIKLQHIQGKLYTKTAQKIARKRSAIMKRFLEILEQEVEGNC
ncbi:MAG: HD domain-containing protein [Firmicutes bacterium]|nr:HD domain-containing protein [Bacillota bacterium]